MYYLVTVKKAMCVMGMKKQLCQHVLIINKWLLREEFIHSLNKYLLSVYLMMRD